MAKYKVGDKVKIKVGLNDLQHGKYFGVVPEMYEYRGKEMVISRIVDACGVPCYKLVDEDCWSWSEDMFEDNETTNENKNSKQTFFASDLITGDIIKRRNGWVEMFLEMFGGIFVGRNEGFNELRDMRNDLTYDGNDLGDEKYDIVEVIRPRAKYECRMDAFEHCEPWIVFSRNDSIVEPKLEMEKLLEKFNKFFG